MYNLKSSKMLQLTCSSERVIQVLYVCVCVCVGGVRGCVCDGERIISHECSCSYPSRSDACSIIVNSTSMLKIVTVEQLFKY